VPDSNDKSEQPEPDESEATESEATESDESEATESEATESDESEATESDESDDDDEENSQEPESKGSVDVEDDREDEDLAAEKAEDPKDQGPTGEGALRAAGVLGFAVGVCFFVYGVYLMFLGDKPMPFAFTMLIGGAVNSLVSAYALRRSRVAWSFALSLNGVAAVVFLFGAPKIRDGLDLHILIALMPCIALSVATVMYWLAADQFE